MKHSLSELNNNQSIRYITANNEVIRSTNWNSVTIDGCIISNCSIINTNLSNSDIIGTTFVRCKHNNSDMSHSDICSIVASDTEFINIDFRMATMRDCEYNGCVFDSCSFEHIAMTHSKYLNCTFRNISIEQSSSYLNEFYNCTFDNCSSKGNFYYSIFTRCDLCNQFLSNELRAFNMLLYNKESQINIFNKDTIEHLKENYLFLNIEIYRLNMLEISLDSFIIESLLAISQLIKNNIVIRLEQIEFIHKVFEFTCKYESLPLLTVQQGINIIDIIFEESKSDCVSLKKSQQCINQLKNTMYLEYISKMNSLPKIRTIDFSSHTIIYKITYNKQPLVQLSNIINSVLEGLDIKVKAAERIKTEKGSFIEFIKSFSDVEPIIQIIMSFTTGVITPIVLAKIKNKPGNNKSITDNSQTMTAINSNINSPTIINNYNIVLSEFDYKTQQAAQMTANVLNSQKCSAFNEYLGYSKRNIKLIEIINREDMK